MTMLSHTVVPFPLRRLRDEAGKLGRALRPATASDRIACHWQRDAATGRPICRWTGATASADADTRPYLRLAS